MIKVNKIISEIPNSLKFPNINEFPNGKIPSSAKTTHKRREEIIDNKNYIDNINYNNRYKQDDTKTALKKIYNNKCAFCEQRIENSHVEHFRPKKIYYWLAFSWDNLMLACATCNQHKGINFEIGGTFINFDKNTFLSLNIHNCAVDYDLTESPKMVNPEVTDPLKKIKFSKNGLIYSDDERFAYTIDKCKIDRADLNDQRRKLLNDFENYINSAILEHSDQNQLITSFYTSIRNFVLDSENSESQFIAFRRFAITEKWLSEIIKGFNYSV